MEEKTKHRILWIGAIGGIFALLTVAVNLAKSDMVKSLLAKVKATGS